MPPKKSNSRRSTSNPNPPHKSKWQCLLSATFITTKVLNRFVVYCAGKQAENFFIRKAQLKQWKAMGNITSANTEEWAAFVGGSLTGERERVRSLVKPWEEPNHGITFRYREGGYYPNSSTSNAANSRCGSNDTMSGSTFVSFPSPEDITKNVTSLPTRLSPSKHTSHAARKTSSAPNSPSNRHRHSTKQHALKKQENGLRPQSSHSDALSTATTVSNGELSQVEQQVQKLEAKVDTTSQTKQIGSVKRIAKQYSHDVMDAFKPKRTPLAPGAAPFHAEISFSQDWDLSDHTRIVTSKPSDVDLQLHIKQENMKAILRPNLLALPKTTTTPNQVETEFFVCYSSTMKPHFLDPIIKKAKVQRLLIEECEYAAIHAKAQARFRSQRNPSSPLSKTHTDIYSSPTVRAEAY